MLLSHNHTDTLNSERKKRKISRFELRNQCDTEWEIKWERYKVQAGASNKRENYTHDTSTREKEHENLSLDKILLHLTNRISVSTGRKM